jgi:hypothetical protein
LVLAGASGVLLDQSWTVNTWQWWVVAMTLLAGVLLTLSGISATRRRRFRESPSLLVSERPPSAFSPRVGEALLLNRVVSREDLELALAIQGEGEHQWRLGEILVAMKVITADELAEALEQQRSAKEASSSGETEAISSHEIVSRRGR